MYTEPPTLTPCFHSNIYLEFAVMSSIGLSGLSNISNDTLQGRYEKALKQINKLIEINRELKEKVGEYEKHMAGYEQEIQRLEKTSR